MIEKIAQRIDEIKAAIESRYTDPRENCKLRFVEATPFGKFEFQSEEQAKEWNHPFDLMNPPEQKDDYLDDQSLRKKLKEMRERKGKRREVYKILAKYLPSEDLYVRTLELIEFGFDAISIDYDHRYGGKRSRIFREASRDAEKIRKLAKKNPLLEVNVRIKMNPCWELVEPLRKGRPSETMTKNLINDLHDLLSPSFDQETKSSKTNFKKRSIPNSIEIIQKIFIAFYGECKDREAFRKSIKR